MLHRAPVVVRPRRRCRGVRGCQAVCSSSENDGYRGFKWTSISSPPNLSPTPIRFPTSEEKLKLLKVASAAAWEGSRGAPGFEPQRSWLLQPPVLRPKPTGELRPIIDLSSLNTHIICEYFKMETLQSIQLALKQHEWTNQIDIKDAYLHIPIQTKYRKYLRLRCQLTIGMVRPGKKAWTEFHQTVRNLRSGQKRTARQIASIIGKLKHWAPYIPRGRLRLRKIQQWYASHWAQASGRWNDQLMLDSHLLSLLHRWAEKAQSSRGIPLYAPTPTPDLFTDASTSGWGASLSNLRAQGTWSEQEARLHVNKWEMMALKPHFSGTTTRVHYNNTTVVAYMRKEGGHGRENSRHSPPDFYCGA